MLTVCPAENTISDLGIRTLDSGNLPEPDVVTKAGGSKEQRNLYRRSIILQMNSSETGLEGGE
jgi:hypothetical protein